MSDRRKKGFYVTGTVRYKAPYDEKVHDGSFYHRNLSVEVVEGLLNEENTGL